MSLYLLQGAVEEGLIYAFVALGLYVSYKVLDIADLTTDGTFALGSVVAAQLTNAGHPYLSILAAMLAGAVAGSVTAFLQTKMKVAPILAGIITMTGLYSINLLLLGKPSLFFLGKGTVFTPFEALVGSAGKLLALFVLCAAAGLVLCWFFTTKIGLSMRATGDNINMVRASSINPTVTVTVGLMISNALVGLSGALWAHYTSQGDTRIGQGTVVIGLAGLILGGIFFRGAKVWKGICAAVAGSVVYRVVLAYALRNVGDPTYLKLISAVLVAVVISWPVAVAGVRGFIHRRREARSDVDAG